MKKFFWLVMTAGLAACGSNPQFESMPEGPLVSYRYTLTQRVGDGMITDIAIWHDETTGEGLLSIGGEGLPAMPAYEMPQPVKIGEEVFDSIYRMIEETKLYTLETEYGKTWFVDAYGYPAWDLEAVFPNDILSTHSDGQEGPISSSDKMRPVNYLQRLFEEMGTRWLATQPIDLSEWQSFTHMGTILEQLTNEESEDTTTLTYLMSEWPTGKELRQFNLKPAGDNTYLDTKTGESWTLKWVEDEVTLVCRSAKGEPLWATLAHASSSTEWDWDKQVEHLFYGAYEDEKGNTVNIKHKNDGIQGLLGNQETLTLHFRNYHDRPAFRFVAGDYPDEHYYGFVPTTDGMDIYDTEIDPDYEEDGRDPDRVLTTKLCHLKRTSPIDFSWLHTEMLDSHYLSYFDKETQKQMLATVETDKPTPQDEWNAWVIKTFGSR